MQAFHATNDSMSLSRESGPKVSLKMGVLSYFDHIMPNANPNASMWNSIGAGHVCIGHVNFMLFVFCLFALGTQRECSFWWN